MCPESQIFLSVYLPGCDVQIRNMVASCSSCLENLRKNPALPLFPTRLPVYPFQMVSANIFQFCDVHYLLLVPNKWPCVARLRTLTSASTIDAIDGFFADFGSPEEIWSDNGNSVVFVHPVKFVLLLPFLSFRSLMA